jgi:hypothetical protein
MVQSLRATFARVEQMDDFGCEHDSARVTAVCVSIVRVRCACSCDSTAVPRDNTRAGRVRHGQG